MKRRTAASKWFSVPDLSWGSCGQLQFPSKKMTRNRLSRILRDNGLSLVLVMIFVGAIFGMALAGWKDANEDNRLHHQPEVSMAEYLASGDFGEAVFENWESEFLQMSLYVVMTVFLFQRGSAESKEPDTKKSGGSESSGKVGHVPRWARSGGWRYRIYSHSLSLALFSIFLLSFVGHVIFGAAAYNQEASEHGQPHLSAWSYLGSSRFWFESLQNWQSEFLAIFAIVVLSIWLRELGSPESKTVFASHAQTGK